MKFPRLVRRIAPVKAHTGVRFRNDGSIRRAIRAAADPRGERGVLGWMLSKATPPIVANPTAFVRFR